MTTMSYSWQLKRLSNMQLEASRMSVISIIRFIAFVLDEMSDQDLLAISASGMKYVFAPLIWHRTDCKFVMNVAIHLD
jgi:hypothetical protein